MNLARVEQHEMVSRDVMRCSATPILADAAIDHANRHAVVRVFAERLTERCDPEQLDVSTGQSSDIYGAVTHTR